MRDIYHCLRLPRLYNLNAINFQGVRYSLDEEGNANISTAYVMSYHTVLKGSEDYYEALRYARIIADNLTATINIPGVTIFPYR